MLPLEDCENVLAWYDHGGHPYSGIFPWDNQKRPRNRSVAINTADFAQAELMRLRVSEGLAGKNLSVRDGRQIAQTETLRFSRLCMLASARQAVSDINDRQFQHHLRTSYQFFAHLDTAGFLDIDLKRLLFVYASVPPQYLSIQTSRQKTPEKSASHTKKNIMSSKITGENLLTVATMALLITTGLAMADTVSRGAVLRAIPHFPSTQASETVTPVIPILPPIFSHDQIAPIGADSVVAIQAGSRPDSPSSVVISGKTEKLIWTRYLYFPATNTRSLFPISFEIAGGRIISAVADTQGYYQISGQDVFFEVIDDGKKITLVQVSPDDYGLVSWLETLSLRGSGE